MSVQEPHELGEPELDSAQSKPVPIKVKLLLAVLVLNLLLLGLMGVWLLVFRPEG